MSVIAETDSEVVVATFITAITEAITLADSIIGGYSVAITENLNPIDKETVIASFNSIIKESFSINDSSFPRGWFIIDDSQSITWVTIDNSQ